MALSQGACFMKFAAVEPKKQPSRLARSKSGRSIGLISCGKYERD